MILLTIALRVKKIEVEINKNNKKFIKLFSLYLI